MPSGGSDFAERVRQWMEEPPQQAQLRQQYSSELEKIHECQQIITSI